MPARSLVLLSVSAGAGHVRAAEALRAQAAEAYPDVNAIHLDLMEWVPAVFRKVYADSFLYVVERYPEIWGYLYGRTDKPPREYSKTEGLRKALERLNTVKFMKVLKDLNPDHVICTHFLPAQLLSRKIRKGAFKLPVWVQVTDFDVHRLWIHSHLAGYFAASEEVAWRMADKGVDPSTIQVTGIPIMPVFSSRLDKAACARELGLDPAKPVLALMAGGAGVGAGTGGGGLDQTAARLLAMPGDFQLIAMAGRNAKLLADLNRLAQVHPGRLFPMGFTRTIERIMKAADLAITKPGGLTSSECLAMGLPMILVNPIPGQEERNADYLLENGAALKAYDSAGLEFRVKDLLANPRRLAALRENALALGKPKAAGTVLRRVLGAPSGTASKPAAKAAATRGSGPSGAKVGSSS
ncbi:MAG: UDP-N-acetylglucosamine:LPS N-acetylglucosamine transferase [Fibrobacteres bacterium]|nr:UDP-N-acetylglucosamine:LPS N-acetylglucosamine transferase [Fibrobacterota bacterium]